MRAVIVGELAHRRAQDRRRRDAEPAQREPLHVIAELGEPRQVRVTASDDETPSRIPWTRLVPTRHGTQIAQLSLARYAKRRPASRTMQTSVPSARTWPEPRCVPAARRSS